MIGQASTERTTSSAVGGEGHGSGVDHGPIR